MLSFQAGRVTVTHWSTTRFRWTFGAIEHFVFLKVSSFWSLRFGSSTFRQNEAHVMIKYQMILAELQAAVFHHFLTSLSCVVYGRLDAWLDLWQAGGLKNWCAKLLWTRCSRLLSSSCPSPAQRSIMSLLSEDFTCALPSDYSRFPHNRALTVYNLKQHFVSFVNINNNNLNKI